MRVRRPRSASDQARETAVVVLPQPPFWFAIAMMRIGASAPFLGIDHQRPQDIGVIVVIIIKSVNMWKSLAVPDSGGLECDFLSHLSDLSSKGIP